MVSQAPTQTSAALAADPTRTPLLNGIRPPGNSFVLPDHKIVYISVTKVACSSLRWMIADLAGEDFERFYTARGAHQSRLMTIHGSRRLWQHTPQIADLDASRLAEISRDNGWFIFAVVRDPWSRLWSAWQSKFLVRHPAYLAKYGGEPWFPRAPQRVDDIFEDWVSFVDARPWLSHPVLKTNVHFMQQVDSVRPNGINYTRIYNLTEMPVLIEHIREHLASVGRSQQLYLPRANQNPLALTARALENGLADTIRRAYRRDFDAFGDRWELADVMRPDETVTTSTVRALGALTLANERIGDMSRQLKALHAADTAPQRGFRSSLRRLVRR